jgi:riboflavin synthase
MFTGIIEGVGTVMQTQPRGDLALLTIALPAALTDIAVGDSISVNGVCLTARAVRQGAFETDCSSETLLRTNLRSLKPTDEVNLERALQISNRLGGHLVTGHVDGLGYVSEIVRGSGSSTMTVRVPPEIASYLVEKGSVAVEGVSLTVSRLTGTEFQVVVIPYTAENTTLRRKRAGDQVNIEVDIIAKYVKRFLKQGSGGLDKVLLGEYGLDRE